MSAVSSTPSKSLNLFKKWLVFTANWPLINMYVNFQTSFVEEKLF